MALGTVTEITPDLIAVEVLASATATNSPPASVSGGVAVADLVAAFGALPAELSLVVVSTAGSATMTVTLRQWLMFGTLASQTYVWCPAGPGADATKGVLNAGVALGETSADLIRHCEPLYFLGHASRVYFEITAIGGTGTAITVFVVGRRRYGTVN